MTPWHDPSLQRTTDTARRARYRLLQSWWRETVLGAEPGRDKAGRELGSLLPRGAVDATPGLNFLHPAVAAYVDARLPQVRAAKGVMAEARLRRNLLSSQPLCCNLFGALRAEPLAAARVLSAALDLRIDEVVRVDVEEAPAPEDHLGDRTAFDAFVEYRTAGCSGFLGIETKYTEPFSARPYQRAEYVAVSRDSHAFRTGAEDRLVGATTNQLWRGTLLTLSLQRRAGYIYAYSVVLSCADDRDVSRAAEALGADLLAPDEVLRASTYETIVRAAEQEPALWGWASAFRRRYLDLSPVGAWLNALPR
jgi:hypothetical protein